MMKTTLVACATLGAALLAAPPAAEAAPSVGLGCTAPTYSLNQFGSTIAGLGYRYCNPPGDDEPSPMNVTVQRYDGPTLGWRAVATGLGEAVFKCTGTAHREYRIAQRVSVTLQANCS